MKNKKMLLAAKGLMATDQYKGGGINTDTEEEKAQKIADEEYRRWNLIVKHKMQKGLTLFKIGAVEIWALNEKNALRKYNLIKNINHGNHRQD